MVHRPTPPIQRREGLRLATAVAAFVAVAILLLVVTGCSKSHHPPIRTIKLCDKPTEDSGFAGCHLSYRDGSWFVTVPAS